MTRIKKLHFKDLNTLRFFAFIPVFLFLCLSLIQNDESIILSSFFNTIKHISISSFDFFFLLSAFLITSLALREYKYRKSFSLKNFYIRKTLRILPILLLLLLFSFFFHNKIIDILKLTPIPKHDIKPYLFGIPNFIANIHKERYSYTVVLWIIFMFVQFYLILGLILKHLKNQLTIISLICVTSGVFTRAYYLINDTNFEFNPLSYGIAIGAGILLAQALRENHSIIDKIKTLSRSKSRFIYIISFIVIILIYPLSNHNFLIIFAPILTSLIFSFFIIEQTYAKKTVVKLRKFKLMSQLGKISYGFLIYTSIISTILIILFESLDKSLDSMLYKIVYIITTFICSAILANLSYNYFEKLFIRIKRDFKKA